MKRVSTIKITILLIALSFNISNTFAQTCEWRLMTPTYSSVDPDGAGPATGSATFTLQIHTISGVIPSVTAISTGFNFQSVAAMIPTGVVCPLQNSPPNVAVSPFFQAGGYTFSSVNECGDYIQNAGGQPFDKRAVGTMEASGAGVTLTTTWVDMYTVTLWTLNAGFPQAGYVSINSGENGTPAAFNTYAVADIFGNGYAVNSLTYTTPLALGGALPVLFSKFEAKCTNTGTLISWATAQEGNSSRFEVERSTNGTNWTNIGTVQAAGNSSSDRSYQQLDLNAGTAFYRIKQVDKDGQFIYTGVERTNCQVKNISSVIYPVPAFDVLNVVIKSDRSVRTQLLVYDMQGKLVKKVDASILSGNNTFKINLIGLASGDYMLRSNDASIELNKLFTISR